MHFAPLALVTALAAAVYAQSGSNPFKINGQIQITAGKPFTIQWTPTTQGPVSLSLRSGASSDLKKGTPIADNIPNSGSYTFTLPPDTVRNSDYTLQINPVGKPDQANYTPQFVVESSNTVESQSNSATSSASATNSGSSSASSGSSSSKSAKSHSSTSSPSSSSGSASAAATTTAAPAPSSGAKALQVQGGMAALMAGAAAFL